MKVKNHGKSRESVKYQNLFPPENDLYIFTSFQNLIWPLFYQSQNWFLVAYQLVWSLKKTQVVIFTLQPSNFFWDISIYFWKSHRFDFLHFLLHFWKNTFFVHISQFFVEYNEIYSRIFYYIWHTHSHQNIRFFKVFRRLMCKYSYHFF